MNQKTIVYCKSAVILGFVLVSIFIVWKEKSVHSQIGQNEKTAGQARKNIQVLKEMPDSQLLPVMHQMRTALGVRCDYCHIAQNDSYWKDDKPEKQIARRMIQMTLDINKANYDGKPVVTCNTCHRGQTEPVPVPAIGQGAFTNATKADADVKPAEPLPSADLIIDKYIQAIGGKAAIEKIKTRYTKTLFQRSKLVNSGTPKAAVINRGETLTIETFLKMPDKFLTIITSPEEVISQGYNGSNGWIKTPQEQRALTAAEVERLKRQADLFTDLKIKERFSALMVAGKEKIGNRETYVIEAMRLSDKKIEKLFFDAQNGLLLRRTVFTETVLGANPEQTDYEDYRMVNNVKIPFVVRASYLDDNHYGTTRRFIQIKNNITLNDEKFNAPDGQKK
jgi:hypothetical protein